MDPSPALSSFSSLTTQLRERLTADLPGLDAQRTMAPRYRARRDAISVNGKDCREAGVLALLYPEKGPAEIEGAVPHLVLTVRRDDLPDHPGQVSFPGGQREAGESLPETALREAFEEIHLPPEPVDILGALTPLYVPPSNFCVHPFVGVIDHEPDLRPTDREVGAILRVPIPHLLAPDTRVVETWSLHGTNIDVPHYQLEDHDVWGATAMMLSELLHCLRDLSDDD